MSARSFYNYFRTYDPSIGRYTQSDPIGLRGGLNTYASALNNPLAYIDSDELNPNKYEKPDNPNKRKTERSGSGTKKGDAGRERNRGHPNAEEHQRDNRGRSGGRSRGKLRLPGPTGFFLPPIIEGGCAEGALPCQFCRDFGVPYPGEGTAFDPCGPTSCGIL